MPQRFTSAGLFMVSLLTQGKTSRKTSVMKIMTEMIRDFNLHVNVLDSVLPILTDDMRERETLLKSVDEHRLSWIGARLFHFHLQEGTEGDEEAEDGCDGDDDDELGKQRVDGGRSD